MWNHRFFSIVLRKMCNDDNGDCQCRYTIGFAKGERVNDFGTCACPNVNIN